MTQEKMTVHKALAELKIIDDRIDRAIRDGVYCKANKHNNDKINGISVEEFKGTIQGSYDKVTGLIARRNAIKRAVVLSNARTTVKINDGEFTVAEAIDMKNHGIEYDEMLLEEMRKQYNLAQAEILCQNGRELEDRAENYVKGLYGNKEGKTNTEEIDKTKATYIKQNSYELIDVIKIKDKIEDLEAKIAAFNAEVDAALSVSNAITEIEISY